MSCRITIIDLVAHHCHDRIRRVAKRSISFPTLVMVLQMNWVSLPENYDTILLKK